MSLKHWDQLVDSNNEEAPLSQAPKLDALVTFFARRSTLDECLFYRGWAIFAFCHCSSIVFFTG
jgi:hypothetical protein